MNIKYETSLFYQYCSIRGCEYRASCSVFREVWWNWQWSRQIQTVFALEAVLLTVRTVHNVWYEERRKRKKKEGKPDLIKCPPLYCSFLYLRSTHKQNIYVSKYCYYVVVVECLMPNVYLPSTEDNDADAVMWYSLLLLSLVVVSKERSERGEQSTDVINTRFITKLFCKDRQQTRNIYIQIMRYDDHDATAVGMQWHIIYANNFLTYVICETLIKKEINSDSLFKWILCLVMWIYWMNWIPDLLLTGTWSGKGFFSHRNPTLSDKKAYYVLSLRKLQSS